MATERRQRLIELSGLTYDDDASYSREHGWNFNGKLRIYNSGRTERTCLIEGELESL